MPCGVIPLIRDTGNLLTPGQLFLSVAVAQDPVVSDLHEALGQDVQEEAPNELGGIQAHHFKRVMVVAVSIPEADGISFNRYQPLIG